MLTELVDKLLDPLVVFGFAGQFVFMLRFVVQLYASERAGRSHVPLGFWWLSVAGGIMLLAYGLLDRDPVIVLGQGLALLIYVRNLMLIYRRRTQLRRIQALRADAEPAGGTPAGDRAASLPSAP